MRLLRFFVLGAAVAALSGAAFADGLDPAIGVKGGTGSVEWDGSTTQFCAVTCNLTLPDNEVPYFNSTGDIIASFDFKWDTPQGDFTALTDPDAGFFNAQLVFPENFNPNAPEVILNLIGLTIANSPACGSDDDDKAEESCSHPPASEFSLVVNGGSGLLTITSSSTLAPVPEPGTMILLGSGLGAVALRKLRRRKIAS